MKKSLILILMFILSIVISVVISGLVVEVLRSFSVNESFLNDFLSYSLLFTLCILIMGLFGRVFHWHIPTFRPQPQRFNLPLIVLTMVTIEALTIVITPLIEIIPDVMMDELYGTLTGGFWPMLTVVVMAAVLEEFLFRGTLQKNFSYNLGPFWGIAIASIIFGAIHIIPQQAVGAFFVGVVIAVVYEMTRSLSTVIIIHMLNNGLAYMYYMIFGENVTSLTGPLSLSGTTYWIVYACCIAYLIGISYWAVTQILKVNAMSVKPNSKSYAKAKLRPKPEPVEMTKEGDSDVVGEKANEK